MRLNLPMHYKIQRRAKLLSAILKINFPAATAYLKEYGVVAFGFPFETIIDPNARDMMMMNVLRFFKLY